jgi:hypothetical protein
MLCKFIEFYIIMTVISNEIIVSVVSTSIQGIDFFGDRASCISHFQSLPWTQKALSLLRSFGTFFVYVRNKARRTFGRVEAAMAPLSQLDHTGPSPQTLVVCIHGLNNNPAQFERILSEIRQGDPSNTAIYIPRVLNKGNAPLDALAQPIFDEIRQWAARGGTRLVLIGVSNGARTERQLEVEIGRSPECRSIAYIRVLSIVGANKGSALASLARRVGLSWVMSGPIAQEMPHDSDRTRQLNREWEETVSAPGGPQREYTYIAVPNRHDWQVPNYDSSLADVAGSHRTRYAIVPGHGHNSVVDAAAAAVAEIALAPS